MKSIEFKADILMLIAAIIWGFAFVFQKAGMETMGPHLFNGVRFIIGSFALLPVIWYFSRKSNINIKPKSSNAKLIISGVVAGLFLFAGMTFQQVGLLGTTAGKAGFITGMYVFFVPLIALFLGQKTKLGTWVGAFIAVIGLYLLSIKSDFSLSMGDSLILMCAIFFAGHVLVIGYLAKKVDVLKLSLIQYITTGVLSLTVALFTETITIQSISQTIIPLLYAGVMSTAVGYTLQVVAQQHAHSSHAAIILSLEGAFAVLGGWLLLNEQLPLKGFIGCALMLLGMLISQLAPKQSKSL
jgi:drug/metabolite transporter (DMT)-like permease